MLSFFSLQRPFPLLLMCGIIKAFDERVCPKECDFLNSFCLYRLQRYTEHRRNIEECSERQFDADISNL